MASPNQDSYGNYVPGANGAIQSGLTASAVIGGTVTAGNGAPTGSALEGSKYTDKTTGQEYTYYNGNWN